MQLIQFRNAQARYLFRMPTMIINSILFMLQKIKEVNSKSTIYTDLILIAKQQHEKDD